LAHPPNGIQGAVDGEHQRDRRKQQGHKTQKAQAAGLAGELGQIAQHLARNAVWNQAFHQPALQHRLKLAKQGKGCEHRQGHRQQRHQGNRGGEGQSTCGLAQAVIPKALAQPGQGHTPGKPVQSVKTQFQMRDNHPAIMPSHPN
jgi:hypothetical protein